MKKIPKNEKKIMTIAEYFDVFCIKQNGFAKKLGIAQSALHGYVKLGKCPSVLIALKIQEMTDGIVSVDTWQRHLDSLKNKEGSNEHENQEKK